MKIEFRPLQLEETDDVYDLFQAIPAKETGFDNDGGGLNKEEFKEFLKERDQHARGIGLPDGIVPSTYYVLFVESIPVGYGKLRHYLTPGLLNGAGSLAYSIAPEHRKKGYGSVMLGEILKKAKEMNIDKVRVTCEKDNIGSYKIIEKYNGILDKMDDEDRFYWINLS